MIPIAITEIIVYLKLSETEQSCVEDYKKHNIKRLNRKKKHQ